MKLDQNTLIIIGAVVVALALHLYIIRNPGKLTGYPCYCKECQQPEEAQEQIYKGFGGQDPTQLIVSVVILLIVLSVVYMIYQRTQQRTSSIIRRARAGLPFREQRANVGL